MNKCRNEKFMATIGMDKLTKQTEVDFDIQRNLPDCQMLNTGRNIVSTAAEASRFDRFRIPANQFECMRNDCVNSGTYYNGGAETVYKMGLDATEFAAGVLTFYVLPPAATDATAVVKLSDSPSMENADQYTVNLADMSKGADGFVAVVIDLTQTPTTVGEGWSKEGDAIYISIEVTGATEDELVGISTIAMFEDMDDFAVSTHVIARCLTGIDGSWDLDEAEETCFNRGKFNTDELTSIEKNLTYRAITSNFWRLNPMYNKGNLVQAWDKEVVEAEVKAITIDGTDYGYVTLPDMDQNECRYFSVQVVYDCRDSNGSVDSLLERLSIPSRVDMDEGHYQLIDNGDGTTTVLFNKVHVGRNVMIAYPKIVEVSDSFYLSDEGVNELRTSMTYKKCYTDGTKWRFVFNNVLITSFPDLMSEDDDAEGELTIAIKRDRDGRFGYAYRIID